jgi:predicted anti-sigma-YlaC factor YlaD
MTCEQFKRKNQTGVRSAKEAESAFEHVQGCSACRKWYQRWIKSYGIRKASKKK